MNRRADAMSLALAAELSHEPVDESIRREAERIVREGRRLPNRRERRATVALARKLKLR